MKNTMNIGTTLQDCLSYNNRFGSKRLNAEQLGAENLKAWNMLLADLHNAAYSAYVFAENNDLKVESDAVDKTAIFTALKAIFAEIGEVKGYKLHANETIAVLMIGYAGKRGNKDSADLQFCLSKLRNRKTELEKFEQTNGVNPDTIQHLKDEIAELEAEKKTLLEAPDNRIKQPTRTPFATFRLEAEHRIARVIDGQQAKSVEELEAEDKARKDKKKADKKSKKSAK